MADVTVISNTIQEFMGERFYLCGSYYQHNGLRLHRHVWETYNGPIPEGYHVHHIDENRANNEIDNLALMPGVEHLKKHMSEPERIEKSRQNIAKAMESARAWHGSKDGYAFHSQLAKEYWDKMIPETYVCTQCGKEYESRAVHRKGNHFCCNNCKAKYGREKRRREHEGEVNLC